MANTVDPKQYQIYVERQGEDYIDYEKITDNASKLLMDEANRREAIKSDLEKRANDLYNQIGTIELNSDSQFSDDVLDAAAQLKKSLMLDQSLLKKGAITINEFKQQMERAKNSMAEWGVVVKNYGAYRDNYDERTKMSEVTGEIIMAPDEAIIKESTLGLGFAKNKKLYVDPVTKNAYYYVPDEDGNPPDFETQQDKFLPISNARNRFQYENNRELYDIGFQVKGEKDLLGTIQDATIKNFGGTRSRAGVYAFTEEQFTAAKNAGLTQEFEDVIFAKTSGTDRGLANTAATMGNFTMALSKEQFRENCRGQIDGVNYCDEKYMIIIDPNDPKGMSFKFDKAFAEKEVRSAIEKQMKLQMGVKEEISNVQYEPNRDVGGETVDDRNEAALGFFSDMKKLIIGNQQTFNTAERDLRSRANRFLSEDPSNDTGRRVEDINRTRETFEIKFKDENGVITTETINRYNLDENGVPDLNSPRSQQEVYQELFTFLKPNGFGDDPSFSQLQRNALDGGFNYDYDDDDYFGDETVETQTGFTAVVMPSFTDNSYSSLADDGETIVSYSDKLKADANAASTGGNFEKMDRHFVSTLPGELSRALSDNGISIPSGDFTITGYDVPNDGDNKFTISITSPFTGRLISETFVFDKANDAQSMTNLINAMDKVASSIVTGYNQSEGEVMESDDDNESAPTQ